MTPQQDARRRPLRGAGFAALISLSYLALSGLWIAFSDRIGVALFDSAAQLTRFQTYKGFSFITATALMMFLLLRPRQREVALRPLAGGAPMSALLLLLVLATGLPLLALIGFGVHRETGREVEKAHQFVRAVTDVSTSETLAFLEQQRAVAAQLLQRLRLHSPGSEACDPEFAEVMAVRQEIANVLVLEADGKVVCTALGNPLAGSAQWAPGAGDSDILIGPALTSARGGRVVRFPFPCLAAAHGQAGCSCKCTLRRCGRMRVQSCRKER